MGPEKTRRFGEMGPEKMRRFGELQSRIEVNRS